MAVLIFLDRQRLEVVELVVGAALLLALAALLLAFAWAALLLLLLAALAANFVGIDAERVQAVQAVGNLALVLVVVVARQRRLEARPYRRPRRLARYGSRERSRDRRRLQSRFSCSSPLFPPVRRGSLVVGH